MIRPRVHRLPIWLPCDRPWLVICAGTLAWFSNWTDAYDHATRIAA